MFFRKHHIIERWYFVYNNLFLLNNDLEKFSVVITVEYWIIERIVSHVNIIYKEEKSAWSSHSTLGWPPGSLNIGSAFHEI